MRGCGAQFVARMSASDMRGDCPGVASLARATIARYARRSRPVQELKRVNRRRSLADLEVELRRPHLTRLTRLGNDLAALDRIAALYHQLTRMGICGDLTVGVPHQNQIAVTLELVAGVSDHAVFRRLHRRAFRHREVDTVVRLAVG